MTEKTDKILSLKKEKNIYITSHLYLMPEVSKVSDFTGDTLAIVKDSMNVEQDTIVVCAVRFIAEMVKIMSPQKKVILAHPDATCPMAGQILPFRLRAYREEHPDDAIVAYINTTAALKAECDACVTTATAVDVCSKLPNERILFIPDRNIGEKIQRGTGKQVETWNCYCPIHNSVSYEDIKLAKELWSNAKVVAHLGCREEVCIAADFCGAAGQIYEYCKEQQEVIIAAEVSLGKRLQEEYPDKIIHTLIPDLLTCNHMKLTSIDTIYRVLFEHYGTEIELPDDVMGRARKSVWNMLEV